VDNDAPPVIRAIPVFALSTLGLALAIHAADAQTGYYNLDSGRPTRIEDAVPTPRGELEAQFLPLRGEWVGGGTARQRLEPKLAYGVLPMTEIELRVPLVRSQSPGSVATVGIASAAFGALHAFNVESGWPALALAGEVVLPVGSLSAPTTSYAVKGLLTKTLSFGRIELNAGGGTWSIRVPPPGPVATPNQCGDPGQPPCLPPDVPCSVVPPTAGGLSFACAPSTITTFSVASAGTQRATGAHWTAAFGIDHTFPFVSTLVVTDVVVDRFEGLYPLDDWTAELGMRKQLTPQVVGDFGVSRRFAGTTQATWVTLGLSYSLPLTRG
jgi:hypothetical protein